MDEDFRLGQKGSRALQTSENIFAACRDGDEFYSKEWATNPEHDVNQTDEHGFTPTHYACMHGHSNIVELFLIRGARTDLVNMGGDTLLHVAAAFGKYDVVMKLLKLSIDPNVPNEHGNTPLHYSAFWNYIGICEVLVKKGALVAAANKYGDTPLSRARPKLRKKLEALAAECGQSLMVQSVAAIPTGKKLDYMEFKQAAARGGERSGDHGPQVGGGCLWGGVESLLDRPHCSGEEAQDQR
eukprot:Em0022g206a